MYLIAGMFAGLFVGSVFHWYVVNPLTMRAGKPLR